MQGDVRADWTTSVKGGGNVTRLTRHVCGRRKEMVGLMGHVCGRRKAEGDARADGTRMRKAEGDIRGCGPRMQRGENLGLAPDCDTKNSIFLKRCWLFSPVRFPPNTL